MRRRTDRAVIEVARQLPLRGWVVGTAGNVSARHGHAVRITPTRTPYATLKPTDLVTVALGEPFCPPVEASIECRLHVAIYRHRPEVGAIVHAHAPWSTAWSCLGEPLEPELEDSTYFGIGRVLTAAHAPSGSQALAEAVVSTLGDSRVVLLERHGMVALGESPERALMAAAAVEHHAHVAWLLRLAGKQSARRPSTIDGPVTHGRTIPRRSAP